MSDTQKIIDLFKNGGVVVFPTDTAFGIGCRMDDENAVKRVYEIKHRSFSEAVLVLVDSLEMAQNYVDIPPEVKTRLVDKYWPGGLSISFKTKPGKVPKIVSANSSILAIRWPKHEVMENIIHQVGVPIVATSANRSGDSTPYTYKEVDKRIVAQADAFLEGECTFRKESTIIDTTLKPWRIVREGAVKLTL